MSDADITDTLKTWSPERRGNASAPKGGAPATSFADEPPEFSWVVEVRGYEDGAGVQGIQCVWMKPDGSLHVGPLHGRPQGAFRSMQIDVLEGEYLYIFANRAGHWNDNTQIITNRMNKLSLGLLCGGTLEGQDVGSAPIEGMIVGFYGCSGNGGADIRNLGTLVVPKLPALPRVERPRPRVSSNAWMRGNWGSLADTPGYGGWGGFKP